MQRLHEAGVEISVSTSGNGLWYFEDKPEVARLDALGSLHYGSSGGRINIARTLMAVPSMVRCLRDNARTLTDILRDERLQAVVIDSEYSVGPIKRLGIPVIAFNNSDVVVHSYRHFGDQPPSIRPQFYAVEFMDYLFHRKVPDLVLSPSLDPAVPPGGRKFRRIGAIVRSQYKALPWRDQPRRVVIMLSGSTFGSPVELRRRSYPFAIDIIGRDAPAGWEPRDGITYRAKMMDNSALLSDADLVVVNGGFSAVSEAFCMRKPMVVVPVPRHAEQWVNGQTVERLGVGVATEEANLEDAMLATLDRIGDFHDAYRRIGESAAARSSSTKPGWHMTRVPSTAPDSMPVSRPSSNRSRPKS